VRQGKINYAGISDTPAWIVAQANTLAQVMGWTKFVALQVEYSLLQRTPERELLPMAAHYGMSLVPWAPLAGGALTGKYLTPDTTPNAAQQGRLKPDSARRNAQSIKITEKVVQIAQAINAEPSSVALQWVMQQAKSSIPIAGVTKLAQMHQNLRCLDVKLTPEHLQMLNEISGVELGFPHDFLSQDVVKTVLYGGFYDKIVR
jgi:aryl-alcohol dehydrogenase-like predicted oxidoreductase